MNKKAYYLLFIISSLILNFNSLVIIRYFIPIVYSYQRNGEYTYPMKLIDNVSLLVKNPMFVSICLAMFAGGILFMFILHWAGFGDERVSQKKDLTNVHK